MTRWIREFDHILRNGISKEQRIFAAWYARRAKQYIDKTMKGIDQEAKETQEMAVSFYRLLEHKLQLSDRTDPPTREEVKEAVEQLKDMEVFGFCNSGHIPRRCDITNWTGTSCKKIRDQVFVYSFCIQKERKGITW